MAIYERIIFRSNYIVIYKDFSEHRKKSKPKQESLANLKIGASGSWNGNMSDATARKCKKIIETFITTVRIKKSQLRKLTFVTLTLPSLQVHDDNFLKRYCLNEFIKQMKRKGSVHVFWRAEPQRNGNIHFHLLMDSYLEWGMVKGHWNRIMSRHKYIEAYRQNMKSFHATGFTMNKKITDSGNRSIFYKSELKRKKTKLNFERWDKKRQLLAYRYGLKTNWSNPNSTDIHELKRVRNVAAYITKYMTKNQETGRKIKGRIWGCSDAIRNLKPYNDVLSVIEFTAKMTDQNLDSYLDSVLKNGAQHIAGDYHDLVLLKESQLQTLKKHNTVLYHKYINYYKALYSTLY